jgi:hypothetical protein
MKKERNLESGKAGKDFKAGWIWFRQFLLSCFPDCFYFVSVRCVMNVDSA